MFFCKNTPLNTSGLLYIYTTFMELDTQSQLKCFYCIQKLILLFTIPAMLRPTHESKSVIYKYKALSKVYVSQ